MKRTILILRVKRLLLCVPLVLFAMAAEATGQDEDIVYFDGERLMLLGRPICADSLLYHNLIAALPSDRSKTTANWDGFTAYWSVDNDRLYLDSVRCEYYDVNIKRRVGERTPSDTLHHIFKNYSNGHRIVAGWLTGKIRTAKGKMIYYQHQGFDRNYEEEMILDIDHGKVVGKTEYHNYVIDGFSLDKIQSPDGQEKLREMFPLHIDRYPELSNVERIVFSVKRARIDGQGNMVECEVEVLRPKECQQIAREIEELFKEYRPWKVSYINGEYRAYGIERWNLPYMLHK